MKGLHRLIFYNCTKSNKTVTNLSTYIKTMQSFFFVNYYEIKIF